MLLHEDLSLCYGIAVASLFNGIVSRVVDSSCHNGYDDGGGMPEPPNLSPRQRPSSPVMDFEEKASEMASTSKGTRRRRRKKAPSPPSATIMQGFGVHTNKKLSKAQTVSSHDKVPLAAKRCSLLKKRGKKSGKDVMGWETTQLSTIIEIQETLLSQDTISFNPMEDDSMKLGEEVLGTILSTRSNDDLSFVLTLDEERDENQEDCRMDHRAPVELPVHTVNFGVKGKDRDIPNGITKTGDDHQNRKYVY